MKEHAAAVCPCHKIATAARHLSLQSSMKSSQMEAESAYLASSTSLWSDNPTSNHVTNLAESMIARNFSRIEQYSVSRTSEDNWEVYCHGTAEEDDGIERPHKSPVPIFWRMRHVKRKDNVLLCTCSLQERLGITCVHTMAVVRHHCREWKGPTYQEQSPCWWVLWLQFGYKLKHEALTSAIEMVLQNEPKGPKFPVTIPPMTTYAAASPLLPARQCLKNYTDDQLERFVPVCITTLDGGVQRTLQVVDGLLQQTKLTQQSMNEDDSDAANESDNSYNQNQDSFDDDNKDENTANNPFGDSLAMQTNPVANCGISSRDVLKPQMNDLYMCLDQLRSPKMNERVVKMLDDLVNELRLEIASGSTNNRNIENCLTVNVNVEERTTRRQRIHASKNCL